MPASVRIRRVAPSVPTASFVDALVVSERTGDTPHVSIPRPEIELVVRFGPAARDGVDVHAFGPRQQVRRKHIPGVRRTVSARLRLGAAADVLGAPASAIAGRIVTLADLWGDAATRALAERLADARDGLEAARVLDDAIAARLAPAHERRGRSPLALDAARRLREAAPASAGLHVDEVAGALGVSARHLRRVFREAIGVGPKTFARVARFDRALRAAREDERAGWAAIAARAGYYDQAHLIAEFRAIAGATPRALLDELRAASVG